ncbi:hypothetical protein WJX81_003373 [Elliptochloris bilobata]|uniref:Uncharacterized protein n=1 Tax=Elliptochloris bilobata TaxID=381761 RepID=A0AAW1RFA3_9CHLO
MTNISILIAAGVGVASGVYIFQEPLQREAQRQARAVAGLLRLFARVWPLHPYSLGGRENTLAGWMGGQLEEHLGQPEERLVI